MANPRPTWADYYKAVADQAKANTVVRGGGSGPSFDPNTISGPGTTPNFIKGFTDGGGSSTSGPKTHEQPINWMDPDSVIAHMISNVPFVGDNLIEGLADSTSLGSRAIDVLSRGTFGTQSALTEMGKQMPVGGAGRPSDWGNIFEQLGKGWMGTSKQTARDFAETQGMENKGWGAFLRNTLQDIALDPLTYVGAGAIGKVGQIARKAGAAPSTILKGASEATEAAAPAAAKAAPVAPTGAPIQETLTGFPNPNNAPNPLAFLEHLNAEATGKAPAPTPAVAAPELAATGTAGPPPSNFFPSATGKGLTEAPNFQMQDLLNSLKEQTNVAPPAGAGVATDFLRPTPQVIAARTLLGKANEAATGVTQRQFGANAQAIPDTGWWNEVTTKVPVEETPGPPPPTIETPAPTPIPEVPTPPVVRAPVEPPKFKGERKQEMERKHADIKAKGDADLDRMVNLDPETRALMSDINTPVYDRYVPITDKSGVTRTLPHPDSVKAKKFKTMGEIRHILTGGRANEYRPAQIRDAKMQLIKHLEAARETIKREATPTPAAAPAPVRKTALKPGPFKPEPKYKEVKDWVKGDAATKEAFKTRLREEFGLSEEQIVYLSKSANLKSYQTRLKTVLEAVRASDDIQDVAAGIRDGRITSFDDPGMDKVAALFPKAKTLPALEKAITRAAENLSTAERKMIEKVFPEADIAAKPPKARYAKKQRWEPNNVTPIGRKVEQMAHEAREAAQKGAETPNTQQIVEKAMKGDDSDLVTVTPHLDEAQHGMLARALHYAIEQGPLRGLGMKYRNRAGNVAKTHKKYGEGEAVRLDTFNKHTQRNVFSRVMEDFTESFNKAKDAGKLGDDFRSSNRAFNAYNRIMPVLKALDDQLRNRGVFPVAGLKPDSAAVSMFDALDAIDTTWVRKNIFVTPKRANGKHESIIMPTQVLDAVEIGLAAMKETGKLPENMGPLREMLRNTVKATKDENGKFMPNHVAAKHKTDEALDEFIDPIVNALPELYARSQKHAAAAKLYHNEQVMTGTQTILEDIARRVESPTASHRAMMELSNNLPQRVYRPAAETHGLSPEDAKAAVTNAEAAHEELGLTPELKGQAREIKERNAASPENQTKMDVRRTQTGQEQIKAANPLIEHVDAQELNVVDRMISSFFPAYKAAATHGLRGERAAWDKNVHGYVVERLTETNKHGKVMLENAFDALKQGKILNVAEHGAAAVKAQKDLNDSIMMLFSEKEGYSVFEALGLHADDVNDHLKHFKVPEKFHLDRNKPIHDEWRKFETQDIISLLDQYSQAAIAAATKKHIGNTIMADPRWASSTAKAGYQKINFAHDSQLAKYIDTENMYYHKDIVKDIQMYDLFLKRTASWGKLNNTKTIKYYDEAFHAWKAGVTVYRAGHHVRNGIGDMWFNHMAGMNSPHWYGKAADLQRSIPGGVYDDYSKVGQLLRGEKVDVTNVNKTANVNVKGSKQKISYNDIIIAAQRRGLMPGYKTAEDISGSPYEGSLRQKIQEKSPSFTTKKGTTFDLTRPAGGKIKNVVTKGSEYREHNVRLAQFLWELDRKSYTSLDEAFNQAAARVRKWHPDGTDLTPMEQNLFRRTTGFYSWIRKAIPLVMESMLTRPGRFMMYPKTMYNAAEAQGIDLQSLSEPFPEDGRYPDWIRDGLQGPVLKFGDQEWGINPGIPGLDVLADWGNAPGSTIKGSLAPAFKVPWEMMSKPQGAVAQELRTEIPYYDLSDYVDKQIPQANYLTGSTGRSLTGLGQPVGGEGKNPEEKSEALRNFINWLSGAGAAQINKPAYEKQAKRQETTKKRDLKRQQQKEQ